MNAGKAPPAVDRPIRRPANLGSGSPLPAPLRPATRGKRDVNAVAWIEKQNFLLKHIDRIAADDLVLRNRRLRPASSSGSKSVAPVAVYVWLARTPPKCDSRAA